MRNALLLLILPVAFALSCNNVGSEEEYEAATLPEGDAPVENPYEGLHAWQGNLDGKYPVLMWYWEEDSVLYGKLYYTDQANAQPITLIGRVGDTEHYLREYSHTGGVTGYWSLHPTRHSAEGSWQDPTRERSYAASLMNIDTPVVNESLDQGADVSGTYIFDHNSPQGPSGMLEVVQFGDKIAVNINTVTEAPAHNIASVDDDTLVLNKFSALHHTQEYGACSFRIRFFKKFATIAYVDDKTDCGFGHRAFVDGVYIKQ